MTGEQWALAYILTVVAVPIVMWLLVEILPPGESDDDDDWRYR